MEQRTGGRGGELVSILCPCYNEESALPLFFAEIERVEALCGGAQFELVFVDDGSGDRTLDILREYASRRARVKVVALSRNFGKEAALTAALDCASGDAAIPIDVDLQDPPELIPRMIELWRGGAEVVLARRANRDTDTLLKRITAGMFYKFHNRISSPHLPENVGDFRLMSRRVMEEVGRLPERQRFMKGIFAWVGFRAETIEYVRPARSAGKSTFNFWRLWRLAVEGITSFSTLPLTVWSYLGGATALAAFVYGLYIAVRTMAFGVEVPGYASLLCLILFLGGIQMLGIGILGEYVGRTYMESKQRPNYVIADVFEKNDPERVTRGGGGRPRWAPRRNYFGHRPPSWYTSCSSFGWAFMRFRRRMIILF